MKKKIPCLQWKKKFRVYNEKKNSVSTMKKKFRVYNEKKKFHIYINAH